MAHTDWTKPKAYIVRMTGQQTKGLLQADYVRQMARFADYVQSLQKKYGG